MYLILDKMKNRKHRIIHAMLDGKKTFTELYRTGVFGKNKRDLAKCLEELRVEGVIQKIRPQGKHPYYELTETLSTIRLLYREDQKLQALLGGVLREIGERNLRPDRATIVVETLILKHLTDYLEGIASVAQAPSTIQSYVRWYLNRCIDRFGRILIACGRKYPDPTQEALDNLRRKLSSEKTKILAKTP